MFAVTSDEVRAWWDTTILPWWQSIDWSNPTTWHHVGAVVVALLLLFMLTIARFRCSCLRKRIQKLEVLSFAAQRDRDSYWDQLNQAKEKMAVLQYRIAQYEEYEDDEEEDDEHECASCDAATDMQELCKHALDKMAEMHTETAKAMASSHESALEQLVGLAEAVSPAEYTANAPDSKLAEAVAVVVKSQSEQVSNLLTEYSKTLESMR